MFEITLIFFKKVKFLFKYFSSSVLLFKVLINFELSDIENTTEVVLLSKGKNAIGPASTKSWRAQKLSNLVCFIRNVKAFSL